MGGVAPDCRAGLFSGMFTARKAGERGRADLGWLDSRHSFSFGDYFDPKFTGFRTLRVINEDRVAAGGGFPTHPHRDMEIFSYVVSGSLEHRDSMGNQRHLGPGQIQLMSAGTGITHSEYNPSSAHAAHFLQVWIQPASTGLAPSYSDWTPPADSEALSKVLLISPDGREDSATIRQDAYVYRIRLRAGEGLAHTPLPGRGVWLQVISGSLSANSKAEPAAGVQLAAGDGLAVEEEEILHLECIENSEALLFDLV